MEGNRGIVFWTIMKPVYALTWSNPPQKSPLVRKALDVYISNRLKLIFLTLYANSQVKTYVMNNNQLLLLVKLRDERFFFFLQC